MLLLLLLEEEEAAVAAAPAPPFPRLTSPCKARSTLGSKQAPPSTTSHPPLLEAVTNAGQRDAAAAPEGVHWKPSTLAYFPAMASTPLLARVSMMEGEKGRGEAAAPPAGVVAAPGPVAGFKSL